MFLTIFISNHKEVSMRLPVFPNSYPFCNMVFDGHLQVGDYAVKTRKYNWKYRGAVLFYTSTSTSLPCVQAYDYSKGQDNHKVIIGAANLVDVRPLTNEEIMKMVCNFNNLTFEEAKEDFKKAEEVHPFKLEKVKVVPFEFGYFFSNLKRFEEPVPFNWPSGPVKPIFRKIRSGSRLRKQLLVAGING
jgi:hypothetical protein